MGIAAAALYSLGLNGVREHARVLSITTRVMAGWAYQALLDGAARHGLSGQQNTPH